MSRSLPPWLPGAIVAGAIVLLLGENWSVRAPVDDAYIFYRYAQHLADGHGLVYNVGERVEGFTSLLWTLLVAAGIGAGGDALKVGHWLGVASGALLLWLSYQYASFGLEPDKRWLAALAPWLLALSMPFAGWVTSGFETPLFAAAVLAGLIAESRHRPGLAVVASSVATLIRPEGIMFGGVIIVFLFLRKNCRRKTWLILLASYLAFLGLLTSFRLVYFDAPLPNTFYAKVGGAIAWWGPFYVLTFTVQSLAPMVWPSAYAWRDVYLTPGVYWTCCVLLGVLVVGGETFYHSRFFVPALPVLCALVVRGVIRASSKNTPAARFATLGVAVCVVWFAFGTFAGLAGLIVAAVESWSRGGGRARRAVLAVSSLLVIVGTVAVTRLHEPDAARIETLQKLGDPNTPMSIPLMARWVTTSSRWAELEITRAEWELFASLGKRLGEKLDARPPENKLVAAIGIGALGFYSNARILDLVGLVDPTIARTRGGAMSPGEMALPGHQRTNAQYVLARNPDYVLIPKEGTALFLLPAVVDLWKELEFKRRYQWDPSIGGYGRMQPGRLAGPAE